MKYLITTVFVLMAASTGWAADLSVEAAAAFLDAL